MRHKPCRYCRVAWPCDVHHVDCPSETNLWPVEERDIEPHGFCCVECAQPFAIGDHYTVVPLSRSNGVSYGVVTCLSCAALAVAR